MEKPQSELVHSGASEGYQDDKEIQPLKTLKGQGESVNRFPFRAFHIRRWRLYTFTAHAHSCV